MNDQKKYSNIKIVASAFMLLMFLGFSFTANAVEIKGVTIPDTQMIGDQSVSLNGAGIRSKFVFDVYIGALYTVTASKEAEAIITATSPRRINMIMLMDLESAKLSDSLKDGLKDNHSKDELAALEEDTNKLVAIMGTFQDIKKGDIITIDFVENGIKIQLNEKDIGSIESAAFPASLLKVWLGAKPASDSLKKALLGG